MILCVRFLYENNLVSINLTDLRIGSAFTNVPYNSDRETTIDHVITQQDLFNNVLSCAVLDDDALNVSSHRPIIVNLQIQFYASPSSSKNITTRVVNWNNVKQSHKCAYENYLTQDSDLLNIIDSEIQSKSQIDTVYDKIVSIIDSSTKACIPKSQFKPFLKPYWNSSLSSLHKTMRQKRYVWINAGRPQQSSSLVIKNIKMQSASLEDYIDNK